MANIKRTETIKQKILNSPNRLIDQCKNSLATLWRQILYDLDIDELKWNTFMNMFLSDPINAIDCDPRVLGDKRGNLTKSLCYDRMQMLVFSRALRFLKTERVTLVFVLYPEDESTFPVTSYDINIFYGENKNLQRAETQVEDKKAKPFFKRRFVGEAKKAKTDINLKKYLSVVDLDQWLKDPNKMVSKATGPLSKVYRRALADRGMTKSIWKTLLVKYQRKVAPSCDIITGKETKEQLAAKTKKRANIRGNVSDELRRDAFTIDVFMKGMVFLEIKKLDIIIRLKRENHDRITEHKVIGWDPLTDLENIIRKYNI